MQRATIVDDLSAASTSKYPLDASSAVIQSATSSGEATGGYVSSYELGGARQFVSCVHHPAGDVWAYWSSDSTGLPPVVELRYSRAALIAA